MTLHSIVKLIFKYILLAIVLIDFEERDNHSTAQHNTLNLMKTIPNQKLFLYIDCPDPVKHVSYKIEEQYIQDPENFLSFSSSYEVP